MSTRSTVIATGFIPGTREFVILPSNPNNITIVKSINVSCTPTAGGRVVVNAVDEVKVLQSAIAVFDMSTLAAQTLDMWVVLETTHHLSLVAELVDTHYWISGALLPLRS